ncbi:hypothetical protein LXA43DRAFT_1052358 [Ganoderma leucocontextum]|nr:hypothetical protein LXA43DRAFT_1052358 [Ganoderma leucocontextum]
MCDIYLTRTTSPSRRNWRTRIHKHPHVQMPPVCLPRGGSNNRRKRRFHCISAHPTTSPLRLARDQPAVVQGTPTEVTRASDDCRFSLEWRRQRVGQSSGCCSRFRDDPPGFKNRSKDAISWRSKIRLTPHTQYFPPTAAHGGAVWLDGMHVSYGACTNVSRWQETGFQQCGGRPPRRDRIWAGRLATATRTPSRRHIQVCTMDLGQRNAENRRFGPRGYAVDSTASTRSSRSHLTNDPRR